MKTTKQKKHTQFSRENKQITDNKQPISCDSQTTQNIYNNKKNKTNKYILVHLFL